MQGNLHEPFMLPDARYFRTVAGTAASDDDPAMKTATTSLLWFLGVWVAYDISAFASGLPRQVTPLVAFAVTVLVYAGLRAHGSRSRARVDAPRVDLPTGMQPGT